VQRPRDEFVQNEFDLKRCQQHILYHLTAFLLFVFLLIILLNFFFFFPTAMTSPLPLLRSQSTETQSREWGKRFSLRANKRPDKEQSYSAFRKNAFSRRCSSLKQSQTENVSLELQIHSSPPPTINEVQVVVSPKKPKWEVIEHFKSSQRGHESISSSLIAVSFCVCVCVCVCVCHQRMSFGEHVHFFLVQIKF
jgi:hypothetical protein